MAPILTGIRYLAVGPSNDHELAIARIVDRIDMEGRLQLSSIQEVVNVVDFLMIGSDTEFLAKYLQWRMANPIVVSRPDTRS